MFLYKVRTCSQMKYFNPVRTLETINDRAGVNLRFDGDSPEPYDPMLFLYAGQNVVRAPVVLRRLLRTETVGSADAYRFPSEKFQFHLTQPLRGKNGRLPQVDIEISTSLDGKGNVSYERAGGGHAGEYPDAWFFFDTPYSSVLGDTPLSVEEESALVRILKENRIDPGRGKNFEAPFFSREQIYESNHSYPRNLPVLLRRGGTSDGSKKVLEGASERVLLVALADYWLRNEELEWGKKRFEDLKRAMLLGYQPPNWVINTNPELLQQYCWDFRLEPILPILSARLFPKSSQS